MACQQHGTENPSLHWEQQEGWLCLPTFSPSEATGIHPTGHGKPKACSSKAALCSWAWGPPSLDLTVGYSSCRTRDLFFRALTLWLCNAVQADLDAHPFIINLLLIIIWKYRSIQSAEAAVLLSRAPCQHQDWSQQPSRLQVCSSGLHAQNATFLLCFPNYSFQPVQQTSQGAARVESVF